MRSFLLLILIVVFAAAAALFIARQLGKTNIYTTPEHLFDTRSFAIIAHRGGAEEAPENTLLAFEKAQAIDPKVILEFDVHLTKDKVPVIIHDSTVDRTTDGSGPVASYSLEELKKLDAAYKFQQEGAFPYKDQGINVPTLQELLARLPEARLILEVKEDSQEAADAVIRELDAAKRDPKSILIGSQYGRVIDYMRKERPYWYFAASTPEMYRTIMLLNLFLETVDPMKPSAFLIPEKSNGITVLSERLTKEASKRYKPVYIWTVNDEPSMRRLIQFGVNGLITDRPAFLHKLISNERSQTKD